MVFLFGLGSETWSHSCKIRNLGSDNSRIETLIGGTPEFSLTRPIPAALPGVHTEPEPALRSADSLPRHFFFSNAILTQGRPNGSDSKLLR